MAKLPVPTAKSFLQFVQRCFIFLRNPMDFVVK